jgi:hypothetical protein
MVKYIILFVLGWCLVWFLAGLVSGLLWAGWRLA